jgi:hypothetical protein
LYSEALFGCTQIHPNPCGLGGIEVKFSLSLGGLGGIEVKFSLSLGGI